MTTEDVQTNIRLPIDLKERLVKVAAQNKRSLSAEVAARLDASFHLHRLSEDVMIQMLDAEVDRLSNEVRQLRSEASPLLANLGDLVERLAKDTAEATGLRFEEALLLIATRGAALETKAPIVIVQVAKGSTLAETRAVMNVLNDVIPGNAFVHYEPTTVPKTRLLSSEADKQALLAEKDSSSN